MKVSERLFDEVKEIWDSYNTHPFVKGIAGSEPSAMPLTKGFIQHSSFC